MNKAYAVILALVISIGITGCSSESADDKKVSSSEDGVSVNKQIVQKYNLKNNYDSSHTHVDTINLTDTSDDYEQYGNVKVENQINNWI